MILYYIEIFHRNKKIILRIFELYIVSINAFK